MMVTFETGANTASVNELILFTRNTKSLLDQELAIYARHIPRGSAEEDMESLTQSFRKLLKDSLELYRQELDEPIKLTPDEEEDFLKYFAGDYFSYDRQQYVSKKRDDRNMSTILRHPSSAFSVFFFRYRVSVSAC